MTSFPRTLSCAVLLALLAACMAPIGPAPADAERVLVYFDEFSANLSPEAKQAIAKAAASARAGNARMVRIEARASATGSPLANQYLAQTRSQVVADELTTDGIPSSMLRQLPIGQTGSGDPTVAERRVDVVIER